MSSENPYFNLFDKRQTVTPIREYAGPLLHDAVAELHDAFPQLSADHLTILGGISGLAGAVIAESRTPDEISVTNKKNLLALSLLAGGIVLDGMDGAMARHIASKDATRPVKEIGSLLNSATDFTREIAMNVVKISAAHKRGDKKGEILGYMAMITNPVARYFYWKSIAEGYDNPETGRNPIEFFGTHVGKPPCYVAATAFPEIGKIPMQNILDATTTISNVVSIVKNSTEPISSEDKTLGSKARKVGELRSKFHIFSSAATLAIAAGTYYALHQRDNCHDSNTL